MTPETDNRQRPAIGTNKKTPITGGFVFACVLWAHVFVLAWLLVLEYVGGPAFWFLLGCLVLALPTTVLVWSGGLPAHKQEGAKRKRAERLARRRQR